DVHDIRDIAPAGSDDDRANDLPAFTRAVERAVERVVSVVKVPAEPQQSNEDGRRQREGDPATHPFFAARRSALAGLGHERHSGPTFCGRDKQRARIRGNPEYPDKHQYMLALSIRQPYAELILRGIKTIEYRSRGTKIVGERFYIYATKRPLSVVSGP